MKSNAGTIEEGEIFGILSFISRDTRSATVIANGDVKVGMILKDTFVGLLNELPEKVRDKIAKLRDGLFLVNDMRSRLLRNLHEIESIKNGSFTREYFEGEAKIDSKLLLSVTDLMLKRFFSTSDEIMAMLSQVEEVVKKVA